MGLDNFQNDEVKLGVDEKEAVGSEVNKAEMFFFLLSLGAFT